MSLDLACLILMLDYFHMLDSVSIFKHMLNLIKQSITRGIGEVHLHYVHPVYQTSEYTSWKHFFRLSGILVKYLLQVFFKIWKMLDDICLKLEWLYGLGESLTLW